MQQLTNRVLVSIAVNLAIIATAFQPAAAQSVCLPAPRLLTTFPMGGQVGTTIDITITGESLEEISGLYFSDDRIFASPKLDANGNAINNTFSVTISKECPLGLHEARLMTRLGISSSRIFHVGDMPEVSRTKTNTTLETAMPLSLNTVCNATMTSRAIDYYTFEARENQRIVVDCAAKGIDSKSNPVLIVANEDGQDLMVERRGGAIDFEAPADGNYVIKIHDLTYNGGPYHFYRLIVSALEPGATIVRPPSTKSVSAFSWPPAEFITDSTSSETEPNNVSADAQKITLPCHITGNFFPAADVDTFEFTAKKGETWWVEVASERLGRPTDPSIVVQRIAGEGEKQTAADVVEFSDIPSPVKVSSNGYAYDGPPYNAGSTDILGHFVIKEDGVYRLKLTDLFGGTRSDPKNIYQLVIRKASPDFALVGWAMHMQLRNGDRNALSKPIALRAGASMPIEVVAFRRDGFNGPIELTMDDLPKGVTATGLKIPAGKSKGTVLVTANGNAPQGMSNASFTGRATINGKLVERSASLASMSWPVRNAWSEIPNPRLLVDVPVSVSDSESAPVSVAPKQQKIWEAKVGEQLTIPLVHTRRCEFSGTKVKMKPIGAGFEEVPAFDLPLDADHSEVVLDLATLKTPPGDYVVAFYGSAVAKYRYNPAAVSSAETAITDLEARFAELTSEIAVLEQTLSASTEESKADVQESVNSAITKKNAVEAELAAAKKQLKSAIAQAKPKDIADILVTAPIQIRVNPAAEKAKK